VRLVISFLLALLLVSTLAACGGSDSSKTDSSEPSNVLNPNTAPTSTSGEPLAALVNGQPITMAAFERQRARSSVGMTVEPATQAAFDAEVLQNMVDQILVEQYAQSAGIEVTDAEVDAELAAQADIAQQSSSSLDQFIADQLYTPEEYREAQRAVLLWYKVANAIAANVPTTTSQVHARHILVKDVALAETLIQQLDQGADFAQLAMQYSQDPSSAQTGGDLTWISEGDLLQPEVEQAIFAMQPGERSTAPVQSSLGYHIIEVLERVEGRPLDEAALAEKRGQAFITWLENQRATAEIERYVG
jgi:parvulin-like peptidyl-prolyl isomerase